MNKKHFLSGLVSLILPFAGLGMGTAAQAADLMDGITADSVAVEDISNDAAVDFFVRLLQQMQETSEVGENVLLSPLSVLYALGMTANGADGDTRAQMESVLGASAEDLNEFLYAYKSSLPDSDACSLRLANSIWFNEDESFSAEPDFLQVNADYYSADLFEAAFDPDTLTAINDWVNEKTDGMIEEIVNEIPEDAVMYLLNAMAFDAEWAEVYTENQIQSGIFTLEDGTEQEADMMYSEESAYLEDDRGTGFLKYYAGQSCAFVGLLPNEDISLADYVTSLTGENLSALLGSAQTVKVNAAIPRFESDSSVEMKEILSGMGISGAFNGDTADFSLLGHSDNGNIYISRVLHRAYIAVDERGTKAGAATAVEMMAETALEEPEEPKTVYLDRPFVYMLIDCETNTPIFMGTVTSL
ncbi:MAG: serpin family protein [Clostridiales bacterium]|nr:serpin family protein [Clostridiales bacterium]